MPDISAIFWLVLLVIFVVAEALTTTLVSIWFAAGALVALIVAVLNLPIGLQAGAFIVISLLLLILTRPIARKILDPKIFYQMGFLIKDTVLKLLFRIPQAFGNRPSDDRHVI